MGMYRIAMIVPGHGCVLLCRGCKTVSGIQRPLYVRDPDDRRVITYGTRWGALKRQAQILRDGFDVVVFDAATGVEIPESLEARKGTAI